MSNKSSNLSPFNSSTVKDLLSPGIDTATFSSPSKSAIVVSTTLEIEPFTNSASSLSLISITSTLTSTTAASPFVTGSETSIPAITLSAPLIESLAASLT